MFNHLIHILPVCCSPVMLAVANRRTSASYMSRRGSLDFGNKDEKNDLTLHHVVDLQ